MRIWICVIVVKYIYQHLKFASLFGDVQKNCIIVKCQTRSAILFSLPPSCSGTSRANTFYVSLITFLSATTSKRFEKVFADNN